jgi:hypothetical protein
MFDCASKNPIPIEGLAINVIHWEVNACWIMIGFMIKN